MEFLATFGLAAKELFDYNRENFQFDADQRLERELMRMDMQIKRFELFREDIRDLVELTVGKMEMYHLVGALFLEKTVGLYCEGRVKEPLPPYMHALHMLATAGGFTFLVLAVWLSMYASICSHSFGVRLLTRFVRLPIPGAEQLDSLNARLSDFEAQGNQMLRVPFMGNRQEWVRRQARQLAAVPEEGGSANGGGGGGQVRGVQEDLLGRGEQALGAQDKLMKATAQLPGKHVQLYRRLQNKWQCYDAYARVSMALGTNQILLAFTFYLMNVTLIEFQAPSATYACILALQSAALALCYIDIAKLGRVQIFLIQALPTAACFIASIEANVAPKEARDKYELEPTNKYKFAPLCFFLVALWFELLLRVAWPSRDDASLPRRFRAVLFLDVFDDAEMEHGKGETSPLFGAAAMYQRAKPLLTAQSARDADEALFLAHAAVRRWEAVPAGMSDAQRSELGRLRQEVNVWRQALNGEAADRANKRGYQDSFMLLELDDRPWNELSEQEQEDDPHARTLLGPFQATDSRGPSTYYFNVETHEFVYRAPEGSAVLSLPDVSELVVRAEEQVRAVLGHDAASAVSAASGSYSSTAVSAEGDGESGEEAATASAEDAAEGGEARRFHSSRTLRGGFTTPRTRAAAAPRRVPRGAPASTYVPPRMPWRILLMFMRALQIAWTFVGVSFALQFADVIQLDYQSYTSAGERRLQAVELLRFERVGADFPQHGLFQPQSISCGYGGGNGSGAAAGGGFLVGTRHGTHLAAGGDEATSSGAPRYQVAPQHDLPPGAVSLCGPPPRPSAAPPCLLGALERNGTALAVWAADSWRAQAVVLPIVGGLPWQLVAGALVPCARVEDLLHADGAAGGDEDRWCLLLVGSDGSRLPVAAVPLPPGPLAPPLDDVVVAPAFDLPLRLPRGVPGNLPPAGLPLTRVKPSWLRNASGAAAPAVVDLHVDGVRGRSWALLAGGSVQAWALHPPRRLGRWEPRWPSLDGAAFDAQGLCTDGAGQVHVVGSHLAGPRWYRAALPPSAGASHLSQSQDAPLAGGAAAAL